MNDRLHELFKQLLARPYVDTYNVGVQFFFNLRNFERLAGKHCIPDNRSSEDDGINRVGGFDTVPDFDFLELEELLWEHIKPTIESNNVTFISTCIAFTYIPDYRRVNMHLHREALREINPSPFNYTFFLCSDNDSSVSFNVVDEPVPREDIFKYKLIDYVSVGALKEYIVDKPVINYELRHGDVMRFDATKTVHSAHISNFNDGVIGAYLVLNGCFDDVDYHPHRCFKINK